QREFQSLFRKDPKLETVLTHLNNAIAVGHKVLCISQFADTALAVYHYFLQQPLLREKGVGLVVSSSRDSDGPTQINGHTASREEVLGSFAPRSWNAADRVKGEKSSQNQHDHTEIDILVGSDTLSVGQNLQDARVLVNLDLSWNPMLHEQRIGRIDR